MKRFLALLALVLGVVSCQTEPEGLNVNVGGEVDTIINVTIPEAETRAGGSNSAAGAFANGVLGTESDNTTMRYILQVYYNGEASKERKVAYSDEKSVAFDVRLVAGRDYQFVVWADVVVNGEQDIDNHYVTKDANGFSTLNNITLNGEWNAMDESRDAFTATEFIQSFNASKPIDITLKRPFAKLRVVTTDIKSLTNLGIVPTTATVEYTTTHRVAFNAFTGKAAGATESKTHNYTIAEYSNESNTGAEYTLFTDYFFAENDVVKFNFNVYEDAAKTKLIKTNSLNTDINVKRNHLTTIKGNILTENNGFTVTIDDVFNGETEYKVEDIKSGFSLQQAINDARDGVNTVITLGADIEDGTFPITVPENKVITVKLNGKKITAPEESADRHKYAFDIKGALTLEGEGEVKARGIYNYGKFTLNGATIDACDHNGGYVICYNGAEFTMNSGTIKTSNENGDDPTPGNYDATPIRIESGAKATINGGTITNVSNYTFALDNYGDTTINGGEMISVHSTVSTYGTMTINGGSFKCNGLEGITAHALVAWDGSETTINGGTFDGKDNYNGFNIDAVSGAVVNINGGEFLHVHSGSLYGDGTINVMGGFYYDDPTARVATGYLTIEINPTLYTVMKGSVENGVNTYVVENTMDLTAFSKIVDKGATFEGDVVKLTEDITLPEENWNPIGDNRTDTAFSGTFDGQNHTISGAKISGDFCWDGSVYGSKEGWGLFSVLDGATVKNVKLDDEVFASYTVISGGVAGYAYDTTFENIDITNTKIAGYNWYTGGVVGWAGGNCTFKDINLDSSVVVGTLWDSHGQNAGGIAGGVSGTGTYTIEDCNIACVMDVINDVTSNYKWWIYRVSGMIIGNTNTTEAQYNTVVTATATNVTCKNVTVTYGDWMNYHYCEGYWNRGWGRVESSDYVGGIDHTQCNHPDGESHYVCIPFDQLFGGSSNGDGHYPVRGLDEFEGVTVNYPASYVRGVSNQAELEKAIAAGISQIALEADIECTETIAINNANFSLDGNDHTITMADTATNAVALLDIAGGKATIKNVVFDGIKEGAVVRTVNTEINIDNITAKNCKLTKGQGLLRLLGKSSVTNSTFIDNECLMVISLNFDSTNNDPQVVDNCVFENNTCNKTAVVYYVKGASGTINGNKFIGNTVNCKDNGATVYMGFQENCTVTNNLFQNNTVNEAGTSSRVAGGVFFGYDMVLKGNAFIGNNVTGTNVVAKDVCVSTYYTSIDLSGNYWGGNAPVENVNYFVQHKSDERPIILNDYLTENPIK